MKGMQREPVTKRKTASPVAAGRLTGFYFSLAFMCQSTLLQMRRVSQGVCVEYRAVLYSPPLRQNHSVHLKICALTRDSL